MDLLRHACYMLGTTTEESLSNCKGYDESDNKIVFFAKLVGNCSDDKKVSYVKKLLIKIPKPTQAQ